MKIGIIGCGYVGKAIASFWQSNGHFVVVTTRQKDREKELSLYANQVVIINSHSEWVEEQLAECELILIAVAPDRHTSSYEETYLQTARRVAQSNLPNLKQIIFISSTSVYGEHDGNWVTETTVLSPNSVNAKIIAESEDVILNTQKGTILRLGEIYGPTREVSKRLSSINGPRVIPGNGDRYANLIHLEEIVKALDFVLDSQLLGVYNLCNDLHPLRTDLYTHLCNENGYEQVTWSPSQPNPHGENKRVSNEKLKNLGFQFLNPKIT